jgi:hypothetical protein
MSARTDELARELLAMMEADQRMRRASAGDREKWDPDLDRRNTARLRQIVDEIGWPSIQVLGERPAHAAWLLAQHADLDPEFQKRCLELMRALPAGGVSPRNLAYLEDRVLVADGKAQRYGTQLRRRDDGTYEALPIADEGRVDERRRSVGLESLAKHLARAAEAFVDPAALPKTPPLAKREDSRDR